MNTFLLILKLHSSTSNRYLSSNDSQKGICTFLTDFFKKITAYELWFKQILWELDSVREIFQNGHVSFSVIKLHLCILYKRVESVKWAFYLIFSEILND